MKSPILLAIVAFVLGLTALARADGAKSCDGPAVCCPESLAHEGKHDVALGVVVMGISNINEKSGTWDADIYLYEEWLPAPGFTPQTELVNEVSRLATQSDEVDLREGKCLRSRRIHSSLRAEYNLRRFPFDHQTLQLELSDNEFTSSEVSYTKTPYTIGVDDKVTSTLSNWKIWRDTSFTVEPRTFKWERGAPAYDYGIVEFQVRRHVTFHLFKFFLPLLIIVALAFTVFWIDPDDLGAPAGIGITCLLAAIAFQFAEQSTLPEISYLTLADRVYVVCYIAIGAALVETIWTNNLARRQLRPKAMRIDKWCRALFPAVLVVAIVGSVLRAFTEYK